MQCSDPKVEIVVIDELFYIVKHTHYMINRNSFWYKSQFQHVKYLSEIAIQVTFGSTVFKMHSKSLKCGRSW